MLLVARKFDNQSYQNISYYPLVGGGGQLSNCSMYNTPIHLHPVRLKAHSSIAGKGWCKEFLSRFEMRIAVWIS